ncbi:MAG: MBL fold metallo-hydrolase [Christensenellales bacterium]|jgi:competence protein ComEC
MIIKRCLLWFITIFAIFSIIACEKGNSEPNLSNSSGAEDVLSHTDEGLNKQELQVLFINVGKADSALVSFGGNHYLVDTGSAESLPMLVKVLRSQGIDTIEGVFLSHNHEDHIGGLKGLLRLFDIKWLYASEITTNKKDGSNAVDKIAGKAGRTAQRLKIKDKIILDPANPEVKFTVLGPIQFDTKDDNDNSLVLYLESNSFSCLFTGDMQFNEENSLLDAGSLKPCTVLKVGNHGNPDASSQEFISAVSPKYAIISTNSLIDEDTPAPAVLDLLTKIKTQVYVTQDSDTGIIVKANEDNVIVENFAAETTAVKTDIRIESIDKKAELLVLRNIGTDTVDLSYWWVLSKRGKDMFLFPEQTLIQPNGTLTVSSGKNPPKADLNWDNKNVWHDKKMDAAILYDAMGNQVHSYTLNAK